MFSLVCKYELTNDLEANYERDIGVIYGEVIERTINLVYEQSSQNLKFNGSPEGNMSNIPSPARGQI